MDQTKRLGHCRANHLMDDLWLPVPFLPDELLSSYLSRCARYHGMRPTRFVAFHLRPHVIWSRDIDRSASPLLLERIARKSGHALHHLQATTLAGWETLLARAIDKPATRGTGQWVTAVGVYHRTRRRYGLQYCPQCLDESPAFRRTWRLAFVTTCPIHQVPLADACHQCQTPLAPHHQQISARHCHACGGSLTMPLRLDNHLEAEVASVVGVQQRLVQALQGHSAIVAGESVSAVDFLHGSRVLVSFRHVLKNHPADLSARGRRHLELSRRPERQAAMRDLQHLLQAWPTSFLHRCAEQGLTQRSFQSAHDLPGWLINALQYLPAGRRYDRTSWPRQMRRVLRRLHGKRLPGWRTARAELLLARAGGRR